MAKCIRCLGNGQYMGNGFMMTDCTLCDGNGGDPVTASTSDKVASIDRRAASYKKAIKDIMSSNSTLNYKDAVKLFDDAYFKG